MLQKKRSIDKQSKQQQASQLQSLNTTKSSLRPLSSRTSTQNTKNYMESMQRIQKLISTQLQKLSVDVLQKQVSQSIRGIVQNNRNILISQKIQGYKQCTILLTKYNQILKKNGKQINQTNSAIVLNIYCTISQQLNKITKQQKHDQLLAQNNIVECIMRLLEIFVSDLQSMVMNNKDRRGSLMRKNSLKKVIETSTMNSSSGMGGLRPSSRGKLSSLSKKQRINSGNVKDSTKIGILDIGSQKQTYLANNNNNNNTNNVDMNPLQSIIYNICCTLKNLSANKLIRKDILKQQYLRTINRYLLIWTQKTISNYGTSILIQLTSACRHIVVQQKLYKLFIKSNCFDPWTKLIQIFPTSNDIIFNILRILSKLSSYQEICNKLSEKKQFIKTLCSFFKLYKSSIHIIIRISYIFANLTSYLADIRNQLYFEYQVWGDIYSCFQYYANSQLKGKSEVEKMGISMAAWDYTAMKKQSDIQALMKIIRLIANLFTVQQIGQHIYRQHSNNYRDLIKTLKILLQKKSNLQKYNQLIACSLSCLTNTLYYDKELLLASIEYKNVKKQLIQILVDFVVQIDNQQICCQALRVISNLTRMKQFIKSILDVKLHQAIFILLNSTSKQIVYYCLGIIINLLADDQFKNNNRIELVNYIIEILKQCNNQDFDIITVSLKALFIIIDNRTENIQPKQLLEIQNCLVNLGAFCDKTMLNINITNTSQNNNKEQRNMEIQSAQQSRNLINALLNSMPQEKYICPIKNCGRKFADEAKLQEHVSRRHKSS